MADARNRGAFIGTGASAIGGAKLATAWSSKKDVPLPVITITPGAFDARFDGDLFSVALDGASVGWVTPPQGGEAFADVVTEKLGGDHIAHKHIANVKYNEFSLGAAVGTSKGFYNWIKASFDRSYLRKNGSVVAADFNFKAVASANFFDALVTEITIPALDATAKDPAYMVLKAAPTATRFQPPSGQPAGNPPPKPPPLNFKLTIDGLDTSRVSKIESFTVKQSVATDDAGTPSVELDIPDLSIWVDADPKATWPAWEDDFLIKGNNDQTHERSGSLSFLDQKSSELFRLSFSNLGVFRGTPSATPDGYPVKWELYCEDMGMAFGDAPWS
jgi:hypothetical protein